MRRKREDPCELCGHHHNCQEGEVCRECGHDPSPPKKPHVDVGSGPSEILSGFLYLGSFHDACRPKVLRDLGISCILNTVPTLRTQDREIPPFKRLITNDGSVQLEDGVHFIMGCQRRKFAVLVHCATGISRSAGFVVAYLMKSRAWRLEKSYQFVKTKRPVVKIKQDMLQELREFEKKIFRPVSVRSTKSEMEIPCGQYYKCEEGEVCGTCERSFSSSPAGSQPVDIPAAPTEILPGFLYLGSYHNAWNVKLLCSLGISHILNTEPSLDNMRTNKFFYHDLGDNSTIDDEAIQFIEECGTKKAPVLVHCLLGVARSAAYVVAYLMKSKSWSLERSYQFVNERRPGLEIPDDVLFQLEDFEKKIFGPASRNNAASPQLISNPAPPVSSSDVLKPNDQTNVPAPAIKSESARAPMNSDSNGKAGCASS